MFFGGSGTFSALVNNNAIDNNGPTVNAGSSGIAAQLDDGPAGLGTSTGVATITVNNNLVLASTTDNLVGSGVNAGIGLRKQGTVATVNDFGIQGIAASPTKVQVQAHVGSPVPPGNNYSADGSGGSANGVDIVRGSNYSTCSLP